MAISAGQIVSVVPRILTGTGKDLVFNGLVLDKDTNLVSNSATAFQSAEDVGLFFGTASDEYAFAQVYFGGYSSSQLKPSNLYFYKFAPNGSAPFVRGVSLTPSTALTTLKTITSGTLNLSINGTEIALSAIDLSGANSLSDVANTIETAIHNASEVDAITKATVAYKSQLNAFVITIGAIGVEGSISYATGTVASAMGLTEENGAVISEGTEVQSLTDALNACTAKFQNFVTFTTLWQAEEDEALELANWSSSNANAGTMYLYVCWDGAKNNLVSSYTSTIADKISANNYTGVTVVYPDYKIAAFTMGTAASINWDARNGTLTFAFKSQDGLGASIEKTADHNTLLNRGVNFIGNYATRNDNFVFFYNGQMFGSWQWIDAYLNAVWLSNTLQVQIMAGFQTVRRVPYTETGYAIIRSWCRDVINRALNNGVIDTGMSLSETQKTALTQELGGDYSAEINNNGYYLQVLDASANVRQARQSPSCNLVYTYAGSVQRLNLPAIAVV